MPHLLFLLTLASTLVCTAVNAYTWRIAYPLWRVVTPADFPALHAEYLRRLGPIITLPHIAMFFASAALIWLRPTVLPQPIAIAIFALNSTVIALSAFVAGPIHARFTSTQTCDKPGIQKLIQISLLRTLLMLTSSALILMPLAR